MKAVLRLSRKHFSRGEWLRLGRFPMPSSTRTLASSQVLRLCRRAYATHQSRATSPTREVWLLPRKREPLYFAIYQSARVRNFMFAPFGRMMRTADSARHYAWCVEHALAGERIFHPLARPARRQWLFPSGQFEEFVSANLQFPILNIQWPPPPFLHPYRPRTRHPSSSSDRLSSSAPAVPAM